MQRSRTGSSQSSINNTPCVVRRHVIDPVNFVGVLGGVKRCSSFPKARLVSFHMHPHQTLRQFAQLFFRSRSNSRSWADRRQKNNVPFRIALRSKPSRVNVRAEPPVPVVSKVRRCLSKMVSVQNRPHPGLSAYESPADCVGEGCFACARRTREPDNHCRTESQWLLATDSSTVAFSSCTSRRQGSFAKSMPRRTAFWM